MLALGLDDIVKLSPPWSASPEVWTRSWIEERPDQRYPLVVKEYHTPKGTLRQVVQRSSDWTLGNDAPFMHLDSLGYGIEYLIKDRSDLPKLPYILPEPTAADISVFREEARRLRRLADQHQVLLEGHEQGAGILAVHLCGQMNLALMVADDPGMVEELLDYLCRWDLRATELLLDAGVDTLVYDGWADMPDYWSLEPYRRLVKPVVKPHVEMAHQAGVPFTYWLDRGVMPLRQDLLELGIDSLWGVDPVQDSADLPVLKREIGGRVCLWGGINGAITIGHGTREDIREAVTRAVSILGPGGGFVLLAVDQIFDDAPWENVLVMIERWKEIGDYPLRID